LQLRVLVLQDFRDAAEWPELVPQVRSAIQHSNLMGGMQSSPVKTYNALVAVHTLTKPFQVSSLGHESLFNDCLPD
jgi:hypothetical protein